MKRKLAHPTALTRDTAKRAHEILAELQKELLPEHASEFVGINVETVQLGLELVGEEFVELADGNQSYELAFAGAARIFGETHEVQIMLTTSQDALIGTRLLNQHALAIEFPGGEIKLRSRPGSGGRRKRAPNR